MKKKYIALIATISTMFSLALADGLDSVYVGMGVGVSNLTDKSATHTSAPGFSLYAGYDVADWMQLEGSFYSVGFNKIGSSYNTAGEPSALVNNSAQVNNLSFTGKFDWWWVDSFALYAKLGLAFQYNNYNTSLYPNAGSKVGRTSQAVGNNSGFQPGLLGGLGLQWNLGRVGLRLEDMYQVSSSNNDAPANGLGSFNTYGFIVQYHF